MQYISVIVLSNNICSRPHLRLKQAKVSQMNLNHQGKKQNETERDTTLSSPFPHIQTLKAQLAG